jgi:hypothetical protein
MTQSADVNHEAADNEKHCHRVSGHQARQDVAQRTEPEIGQEEHLESMDARNSQSIHQIRSCRIYFYAAPLVHLMNRGCA